MRSNRQLENAERNCRIPIEIRIGRIVEGRQLDSRDILQANHRIRCLLDQDIGEFVRIGQASESLNGHLEGTRLVHRWLTEHTRRNLNVLGLQSGDDIPCREAERLQVIGVKPDAHGIVTAAEYGD